MAASKRFVCAHLEEHEVEEGLVPERHDEAHQLRPDHAQRLAHALTHTATAAVAAAAFVVRRLAAALAELARERRLCVEPRPAGVGDDVGGDACGHTIIAESFWKNATQTPAMVVR